MKIAFLNIYQNKVDRGAETFVLEVSKRLSKKHTVDIISGKRDLPKRWPFFWRTFLDPQGIAICLFTLKNFFRVVREKYDVVIPLNGGWMPAWIRIATWLYGGKMVISGQAGMGWDDLNNLWSFPNAFVALSSKAKTWAKIRMPLVKTEYIPNGVDTDKFKKEGDKIETKLKRPVVLTVSALTKTKRVNLVIEAVAKVKDASLLIVGKGPEKKRLESLANELLGGRFEIKEFPFKEMPKVYRVADLFTLASEPYYSFEIVLTEAMATNVPVVANNDKIRQEIVGKAGILVNPEDSEKYAQGLKEALSKNWDNLPKKQAEKFDWDKIAEKYEDLFESLAR